MNTEKCQEWVARDAAVIAPTSHLSYYPFVAEKSEGALLTDADGNEFIDFLSGASSLNLGSRQPDVVEAVTEQLQNHTQYAAPYAYNKPMIEYAERLTSVFPGEGPAKICFGNCGSDANDAAIKFARAYTGRKKIITFFNAYHGNTYGSSSMTTCSSTMHKGIGPFLPEIYHFPYFTNEVPDDICRSECLKDMEFAFESYLSPEEVAAVIIEPIQGDGGMTPAHPIFMSRLYKMCRDNGILFISEEVQQGFYRTGPFFAIENYPDIKPDCIIMGKSLGAGLAAGAIMGRAEIMDVLDPPAHLFTLSGNAVTMAAGIAQFDVMQTKEFQDRLQSNIRIFRSRCRCIKEKYPQAVMCDRGIGMSGGLGIGTADEEGILKADVSAAYKIVYRSYENGLIMITLAGNILRLQPPLNIEEEQLNKGFDIIDRSIADLLAGNIPDDVLRFRKGW
ncbi:MAG: aminotransferase class III-fold pyridoxal phosphate-dependent enzyme [Eubacteriaceae bacterium]|nr:aminotransferase class III-fold pyridoxal phosphate-dependent enzyme [Eubacteriaceae bacterium]